MSDGVAQPASIQIPPQLAQLLGMFTNLSATAVIFWIVIIEMPAARKEFREEMTLVRNHNTEIVGKLTNAIDALADEFKRRPIN